jgi:hypothetical protein
MLSPQDIQKLRKSALESVNLSNEMKPTAVDEKLRALNLSTKKHLAKKGASVEVVLIPLKVDT